MKVLEVKNNLVKIEYSPEDNLLLSGFVIIEDSQSPYVAQILSLKADRGINYAIVKLLFTFNGEGQKLIPMNFWIYFLSANL